MTNQLREESYRARKQRVVESGLCSGMRGYLLVFYRFFILWGSKIGHFVVNIK